MRTAALCLAALLVFGCESDGAVAGDDGGTADAAAGVDTADEDAASGGLDLISADRPAIEQECAELGITVVWGTVTLPGCSRTGSFSENYEDGIPGTCSFIDDQDDGTTHLAVGPPRDSPGGMYVPAESFLCPTD